jgi:hypothetical protein
LLEGVKRLERVVGDTEAELGEETSFPVGVEGKTTFGVGCGLEVIGLGENWSGTRGSELDGLGEVDMGISEVGESELTVGPSNGVGATSNGVGADATVGGWVGLFSLMEGFVLGVGSWLDVLIGVEVEVGLGKVGSGTD